MVSLRLRRMVVSLSLGLVVLLGLLAQWCAGVDAQGTASHPVVGGWRFANDLGGGASFPSIGLVHADGTYIEVLPDGSVLTGVWQPTGERTADLTISSNYVIEDKLVAGEGRLNVEVDARGNVMTQTGTFVGLFEDGSIDIAVETKSTGTRLEVLPVVPLGTPVLPPDMAGVGTPEP